MAEDIPYKPNGSMYIMHGDRMKSQSPTDILISLSIDIEKQIEPHKCIFEPTPRHARHHYKIPDGNPKVIAWAETRKIGIRQDTVKRPCSIVNIKGDLLDTNDPISSKFQFKPNADFVRKEKGGVGEWQIVIYQVSDDSYQYALHGLIKAARSCLNRAAANFGGR